MAIKAVLFDLGNTLVRYYQREEFPGILRQCLYSAADATGQPASGPEHDELFQKARRLNPEAKDFKVRHLADRIEELFPTCTDDPARLDRVLRAFMTPIFATARRDPAAHSCLDELRRRGIKLAIVSNTPWGSPADLWRDELRRHALLDRVDAAVFCVEAGWRKPHAAPFEQALGLLGVAANEAAFVGDEPVWDVEGAQAVGLRPILLSDEPSPTAECTIVSSLAEVLELCAESD